ncbi:MAG TPA: cupin domain-containing protein [Trebonia sp.]
MWLVYRSRQPQPGKCPVDEGPQALPVGALTGQGGPAAGEAGDWEIHPFGQEVVSVLSGHARLVLRPEDDGGEEQTVALDAGTAFVVPRNRWHRLEIDGPTDLQSITPRRGSRLEPRA